MWGEGLPLGRWNVVRLYRCCFEYLVAENSGIADCNLVRRVFDPFSILFLCIFFDSGHWGACMGVERRGCASGPLGLPVGARRCRGGLHLLSGGAGCMWHGGFLVFTLAGRESHRAFPAGMSATNFLQCLLGPVLCLCWAWRVTCGALRLGPASRSTRPRGLLLGSFGAPNVAFVARPVEGCAVRVKRPERSPAAVCWVQVGSGEVNGGILGFGVGSGGHWRTTASCLVHGLGSSLRALVVSARPAVSSWLWVGGDFNDRYLCNRRAVVGCFARHLGSAPAVRNSGQ